MIQVVCVKGKFPLLKKVRMEPEYKLHVYRVLGGEADHSPPTSAEVKNTWIYTSIPLIRLHGVVLN
jgi:hypothetical protein